MPARTKLVYSFVIYSVSPTLWLHRDLDRLTTIHLVQRFLIFADLEHVSDLARDIRSSLGTPYHGGNSKLTYHALHLDFAAIQVSYRSGETVRLRK